MNSLHLEAALDGPATTEPKSAPHAGPASHNWPASHHAPVLLGGPAQLEAFRAYLLAVAGREIRPEFRARLTASDLVQQTLADAAQAWDRFTASRDAHSHNAPSHDDILRWLRRILANNLCDGIREITSAKRAVGRELRTRRSNVLRGLSAPRRDRPEALAIRREEFASLDRAIGRLPDAHRRAVLLRHRDQASFAEIGRVLGISENAAQKLWTRAVDSLRAELKTTS